MNQYKTDFPIFDTYPELVYLDSAATSQKPKAVVDKITYHYTHTNANIHRGMYDLSQQATDQFEAVREQTAQFIGANDSSEIVFTSNATEAINLVAYGWAKKHLKKGDIIVTSIMEHHSNLVPWLRLKDEIGVEIHVLPVNEKYRLVYQTKDLDAARVKLVTLTHASNVLGTINPIREVIQYFKEQGIDAKVLVDAAQSVPHFPVDVSDLGADFIAFSAHKMLGPTGVGVLWAEKDILDSMEPLASGGHMIASVTTKKTEWADAPARFEAGTRNIEGVIGFGAALAYLNHTGMEEIAAYEQALTAYALEQLSQQPNVKVFGPADANHRLPVFSFAVGNVHPHDISEVLNRRHIAIRAGRHCTQPLMQQLGVPGTARASLALYNTTEDVDACIAGIQEVKKIFKV